MMLLFRLTGGKPGVGTNRCCSRPVIHTLTLHHVPYVVYGLNVLTRSGIHLPSVQADTDKQRLDEQLSNAMASVSHLDGEKEALAAQLGSLRCEFEERVATMAHTEQALLSAEARAAGANESLERLERLQKAYSELSSKVDNSAAAQGALETKCKELTTVWQQVPSQTHLKPISNTSLFFKSKYYVATNWG